MNDLASIEDRIRAAATRRSKDSLDELFSEFCECALAAGDPETRFCWPDTGGFAVVQLPMRASEVLEELRKLLEPMHAHRDGSEALDEFINRVSRMDPNSIE